MSPGAEFQSWWLTGREGVGGRWKFLTVQKNWSLGFPPLSCPDFQPIPPSLPSLSTWCFQTVPLQVINSLISPRNSPLQDTAFFSLLSQLTPVPKMYLNLSSLNVSAFFLSFFYLLWVNHFLSFVTILAVYCQGKEVSTIFKK